VIEDEWLVIFAAGHRIAAGKNGKPEPTEFDPAMTSER
jgi:hypothetical protein